VAAQYEYALEYEAYDGGWWPERRGNFDSAEAASEWCELARPMRRRVVRRREVGGWETVTELPGAVMWHPLLKRAVDVKGYPQ
jgi:hypothetical protein